MIRYLILIYVMIKMIYFDCNNLNLFYLKHKLSVHQKYINFFNYLFPASKPKKCMCPIPNIKENISNYVTNFLNYVFKSFLRDITNYFYGLLFNINITLSY